jgi:D-tyrosyl-tRNA(Tyr) deacylase
MEMFHKKFSGLEVNMVYLKKKYTILKTKNLAVKVFEYNVLSAAILKLTNILSDHMTKKAIIEIIYRKRRYVPFISKHVSTVCRSLYPFLECLTDTNE